MNRLDNVLVCTRSDLSGLLPVEIPSGATIREMNMGDAADVRRWLDVHNAAYQHQWTETEYRNVILEHRHIRVSRTFLLDVDGQIVGTASIGRFRRNENVGVGHYLGVVPSEQSHGLGRVLVAYRYHALRDEGVTECESQTQIKRVSSLRLHFAFGFVPKWHLDEWNNPDTWSAPVRAITNVRLYALHRRWLARSRTSPATR
ncbi:MAG TPA: GNAT family N-acetyltransferase [Acidimicrobiia bacterium]|nr:GNAT family N-acetyltransferase [Acidimicrobiia bacterium]